MTQNRTFITAFSALPNETINELQGAGDKTTALYRAYAERIYSWLKRECRNGADAEEITQATFLRLYELLDQGKDVAVAEAWLFTVARRLLIDHIRAKAYDAAKLATVSQSGWFRRTVRTPEEVLLNRQRATDLRDWIGTLTPLERSCLQQRARGLRLREIAEIVGVDKRRVSEEIAKAVRKLRGVSHE
jgi:RNA polymerase sigma factor (sigma-70 family)